ncbi:MAG: transglutaminase-like domain-containing protein [Lachnospiraceae bacterium]|nr:transglutaminase-like domain-containing protein [Lachnospiraceae bacterium]
MINFLFDLIYIVPLSLIPSFWALAYYYPKAPLLPLGILCAFLSVCILIFAHLKTGGKLILGGAFLTLLAVSYAVCPAEIKDVLLTEYSRFVPYLLCSVGMTLVGKLCSNIRAFKIILSLLLIIGLSLSLAFRIDPGQFTVSLSFFYILCTITDETRIRHRGKEHPDHKAHLVCIAPFLVLFLILLLSAHVSEKPYDWAPFMKIYHAAANRLNRINDYLSVLGGDDNADAFMGFSDNGSINGTVADNAKTEMKVTPGLGSASEMYLAGKSFDTFDGKQWIKTHTNAEDEALTDGLIALSSVLAYGGESYTDLIHTALVDVEYQNMYTRHIFTPGKNYLLDDGFTPMESYASGGDYYFTGIKGYRDRYRIKYLRYNMGNPEFDAYLQTPAAPTEETWQMAQKIIDTKEAYAVPFEEATAYEKRVAEMYLKPVTVSPRLAEYLDTLLSDCSTDNEKLKKIERLLSSMHYNTMAGKIPDDVDTTEEFLDYLIFEKQEGYCVYYATAFVLLARYEGIPAKYVQGYQISGRHQISTNVTGSSAHAWPECYIDGIGWVIYEPTPGRSLSVSWMTTAQLAKENAENADREYDLFEKEPEIPELLPAEEAPEKERPVIHPKDILTILAATIAVTILLSILNLILGRIVYKASAPEKRFLILYRKNLRLLAILGCRPKENETNEEFKNRCDGAVELRMLSFLSTYDIHLYRGDAITEKETEEIAENNKALTARIKERGIKGYLSLIPYYFFTPYAG